jgi:hypothetical protein
MVNTPNPTKANLNLLVNIFVYNNYSLLLIKFLRKNNNIHILYLSYVLAPRYGTLNFFDEVQIGTNMIKFPFDP